MENIIVALIAAIPPTILAIMTLRNSRKNNEAIKEVHYLINSRMTELLDITGKSEKAKGVIEGRAEK